MLNAAITVTNLFDIRNVTGVFNVTGNPTDDGYLTDPETQSVINAWLDPQSYRDMYTIMLNNNYWNYSSPRRIRCLVDLQLLMLHAKNYKEMKNIFIKTVLLAFLFSSTMGTAVARECTTCKSKSTKKAAVQSKAAVCKRAQSTAELNINNVRALINGYGNMWYDGSITQYHIPKDGTSTPLYCAALWIGGTDVNDQLRLAALRFGSEGDDYWPGPLTIDGTADVSSRSVTTTTVTLKSPRQKSRISDRCLTIPRQSS